MFPLLLTTSFFRFLREVKDPAEKRGRSRSGELGESEKEMKGQTKYTQQREREKERETERGKRAKCKKKRMKEKRRKHKKRSHEERERERETLRGLEVVAKIGRTVVSYKSSLRCFFGLCAWNADRCCCAPPAPAPPLYPSSSASSVEAAPG